MTTRRYLIERDPGRRDVGSGASCGWSVPRSIRRNMTCTMCKSIFASPKRRSYAAHLFVHLKLGKQRRTDVHVELIANGAPEIAAQKRCMHTNYRITCLSPRSLSRAPETKELQRRTEMLPNAISTHDGVPAWLCDGSLTKRPVVKWFPKTVSNAAHARQQHAHSRRVIGNDVVGHAVNGRCNDCFVMASVNVAFNKLAVAHALNRA